MSQPKTSGRFFGFLKSFMRLCICFDAAAAAGGDQKGKSNKMSRRCGYSNSIKSSSGNASGGSPMVDEDRDKKIRDLIVYCKMNSMKCSLCSRWGHSPKNCTCHAAEINGNRVEKLGVGGDKTIQGAAVARPGKVVGTVLRAATGVEALEQQQRRMVRNPAAASQYPKRTQLCKSNRPDEDCAAEGPINHVNTNKKKYVLLAGLDKGKSKIKAEEPIIDEGECSTKPHSHYCIRKI